MAVLRSDQRLLFDHLEGWDLRYATPDHGLEPWHGERLELPVHGIWVRPRADGPWFCELLLQEAEGAAWVYRRDARVRRPLTAIGGRGVGGLPVLAAEIVLLFKAKDTRERDERDFAAVLPVLSSDARRWLADALQTAHPGHPWRTRLA